MIIMSSGIDANERALYSSEKDLKLDSKDVEEGT